MKTRFRKLLFCFITACCFATETEAQPGSPLFRHFSTEDGLPSSETYFVLEDSKGYMWFATDHGVVRYNGYEFHTFTTKDGLTDNTVFKLYEDNKGRIWMLTFSNKIFYFENNKISPYRYNSLLNKENDNIIPMGIYVDADDNLLATFLGKGELKIDSSGKANWILLNTGIDQLRYIIDEINPGDFLISACYNENYYNTHPVVVVHNWKGQKDTLTFPPHPTGKFSALRINDHKLIYASARSVFESTNGSLKFICEAPAEVTFLMKDDKNIIWMGTTNGAYCFADANLTQPLDHYLEKKSITGIRRDHEGGFWFTSLEDGIFYLPGDAVHSLYFAEEFLQKPLCFAEGSEDAVYAGYLGGAVVEIHGGHGKMIFHPEEKRVISSLFYDQQRRRIYMSESDPGYLYNKNFHPLKYKLIHGLKTNFLKTTDGNLFCGGSSFILKIENDSLKYFTNVGLRINCIAETESHQLLFGCNSGVYSYDDNGKKTTLLHKDLNNVRVDDMRWIQKNLCLATRGKGVLFFADGIIKGIDERKGLCSDLVTRLFVKDNDVWCATNNGISHIHFTDFQKFDYTISSVYVSDGLLSNEITDITEFRDTIYVATKSGISFFKKSTDFINHTQPPVHITGLKINNEDSAFTGNMEFSHNMNNIRLSFVGISYRSKGKISYQYTLTNGTDTVSEKTSNRDIEFLSLAPGHYTFSVAAVNNSQLLSPGYATFSFYIKPAWWQTWWFRFLIVILLIVSIYAVYKMQVKKMKEKFDAERSHASLHLIALRAQMNPHFIFNMMSSIRSYMQKNDSSKAEKYLTSFAKHLRSTLDNSEIQEISLEEELKALKTYAELEMQGSENGFEYIVRCDPGIDMTETMLPSLLLQPFIENSVKHGISRLSHPGKIMIEISQSGDSILIAVEDNGVGRKEAARLNGSNGGHISHGTALTFDRISAFNKAYNRNIRASVSDLTDKQGKCCGTRVEILI